LLEQDKRTIEARMRDLGYRQASVDVRQGVSLSGDNLIITFAVNEGALTRIAGVEVRGNKIYTDARLRKEIEQAGQERCDNLSVNVRNAETEMAAQSCTKTIAGAPFSRMQARADGDGLLNLYARSGYVDAKLDFSIVDLPDRKLPDGSIEKQVRVIYTINAEGDKVFINRIIINGAVMTKEEAIRQAIPLKSGDVLRVDRINESERILYGTDAYRQVIIHTEPAGETPSGFKKRDVVIDVEELKPRVASYGGGFSTENGPLVFGDVRNVNLFGELKQGAVRGRFSRNQQLFRLEYLDPRFRRYGENRFAPLSLSAQYLRDATVTRFFRSVIDRGNFGIVQRLDAKGNPIDEFGKPAGDPTINRFTLNAETRRDFDPNAHTVLFLRYSYEDVRLLNIGSLLIKPILQPDRAIRLSRLGATFVRDKRNNQFDATRGDYFTLDYSIALRQLGGNLSFSKLLTNYRRYYKVDALHGTVFAGNVTLGLANLFNPRDRNGNGVIDEVDRTLPISERFFSGGSTTLRGFGYEEAGPRQVIVPQGQFRDSNGKLITLNPFLVPIGGNALAVVNAEARVPLTMSIQAVPFYDGGNVFRRVSDIFSRKLKPGEDPNLHAEWTHTVGLGFRFKTPFGGALAIDYGFLLNPPKFLLPQGASPPATIIPKRTQLHLRFTQTF
jgi:outer membrane protein insertion porin family